MADLNQSSSMEMEIKDSIFLQYLLGVIYASIILVSFAGNLLVVLAVLTDQRLHNVNHYLLMSLALADLTVTILVMPFALHYDIGGGWEFEENFCSFWMSVDVMCCTSSLQHLCAVAWDRYVAISDPYNYKGRMTKLKVALLILGIWIVSSLISFLPIFMGWFTSEDVIVLPDRQCFLQTNPIYAVISASISFYFPLIGMIFCYAKIFEIAWEKNRAFEQQQRSLLFARQASEKSGMDNDNKSQSSTSWKATKTLGVIFGLFVLCWFPFFIVYWLDSFAEAGFVPQPVHSVITWLGYLNSTMNPIVYSRNEEFRTAYCKLLTRAYYMCRKSKRGLVKGMCNAENKHSMVFSNFSNPEELTEEDILELEKIFWPVSKPLFNPLMTSIPDSQRNDHAVGSQTSCLHQCERLVDCRNEILSESETIVAITFDPTYGSC